MESKMIWIALAGILLVGSTSFAVGGFMAPGGHAAILESLENMTYSQWASIIGEHGNGKLLLEKINESNFGDYKEMVGYERKAAELRMQLGLVPKMDHEKRAGMGIADPEHQGAIRSALVNGTYSDWVAAMTADGNSPRILEFVNESNFAQFKLMNLYMAQGEIEKAKEIREEIGLPEPPPRPPQGPRMPERRGMNAQN